MANSVFAKPKDILAEQNRLLDVFKNMKVRGGGNQVYQGMKVGAEIPVTDKFSVFNNQGISNDNWNGIQVKSPEVGAKYAGDGFTADGSFQRNSPVDGGMIYNPNIPENERRFRFNFNLPF